MPETIATTPYAPWGDAASFLTEAFGCPVEKLPTLPIVAVQLIQATQDEQASAETLVRIIGRDPTLTARLLRIANSPFFATGYEVTTLSRAVVLVGFEEIRRLALGLVIFDSVERGSKKPAGRHRERLWTHSLIVGLLTETLAADEFGLGPGFYTFGLIHDIGKVAIDAYRPEDFTKILESMKTGRLPWPEAEQQILGFDHGLVGQALLDHWGLPAKMTAAVGGHHRPWAVDPEYQDVAGIVFLANLFAKILGYHAFAPETRMALKKILTMQAVNFLTVRGWVFEGRLLEHLRTKLKTMLGQFDPAA